MDGRLNGHPSTRLATASESLECLQSIYYNYCYYYYYIIVIIIFIIIIIISSIILLLLLYYHVYIYVNVLKKPGYQRNVANQLELY